MQQFLAEGREQIQEAGEHLLALEKAPGDAERIAALFRVFHTLKGSSGIFDLRPMTQALHTAEDVLDQVRGGRLAISAGLIDVLLECLDHTARWLDALEARDALPPGADAEAAGLVQRLRRQADPEAEDGAVEAVDAADETGPSDLLDSFREAERMAALERLLAAPGSALCLVEYDPEPGCFFNGDDPLRILRNVHGLAALRIEPRTPWPAPAELDPFTCALGFRALALGGETELREVFRYVFDQARITAVEPVRLIRVRGKDAGGATDDSFRDIARRWREGLTEGLPESCAALRARLSAESGEASALRWMVWQLKHPDMPAAWRSRLDAEIAAMLDAAPEREVHAGIVATLLAEQVRLLSMSGVPENELAGRRASAATVAINALLYEGRQDEAPEIEAAYKAASGGDPDALIQAIRRAIGQRRPAAPARPADGGPDAAAEDRAGQPGTTRLLRVDEARVDRLMRLVGEMVVAKNGLGWLADMARQGGSDAALMRGLRDLHGSLDRLTREMHGMVLQIRMLPIGQVFQRFPRLVRDLSHRLGKPVTLVLEGEGTEADKTMIEQLFEPILHLVRNSLDHGIEPPDQRAAAGKPATATLTLRAYRGGDRVVVEVADDGRGIDADAVRRKALANGLLTADQTAALSDEEAIQLIFAAGLSTMEAVSELSGRGVGMNAVRAAMEKAGGSVEVQSVPGAGATVRLSLPLSLTSVRILTVEVGNRRLGVPMDVVAETVRLPRSRIIRIKQHDTFVLRDRVVPLRRLGVLLGLSDLPPPDPAADARVLVVEVDGRMAGVEVDAFGERLDAVLKPMDGLLSSIPGYIGTTLLGNGEVLLILDVKEILR